MSLQFGRSLSDSLFAFLQHRMPLRLSRAAISLPYSAASRSMVSSASTAPGPVASTSKIFATKTSASPSYASAGRDELLQRIAELESSLRNALPAASSPSPIVANATLKKVSSNGKGKGRRVPTADESDFFDRYPSRKIALKFSYEGWPYCGLALQSEKEDRPLPLPTVEAVLLDALVQARLIKPELKRDTEALGFSRCGRTDRGVSAAGQVVSLWVRSQLREQEGQHEPAWKPAVRVKPAAEDQQAGSTSSIQAGEPMDEATRADLANTAKQKAVARDAPKEELPYMSLLNRCLPPSIRILGWSTVKEDFDARFSCAGRHYKYFFSSTALAALNVEAMQDAASRLVGEHDFRNLCKVDPTKQIVNFRRRIISAVISELEPRRDRTGLQDRHYVLDLKGTAFLYHQVRHIMAVLFLVGSGRERPNVVDALLDTGYSHEIDEAPTPPGTRQAGLVPSKPSYEMADDLPLVLWDCSFHDCDVSWRQDSTPHARAKAYADMHLHTTSLNLKSTISEHFLRAYRELEAGEGSSKDHQEEQGVVQVGAGRTIGSGRYTLLLERPRADLVEVVNQRWLEGYGKRRADRKAVVAAEADGRDGEE